MHAGKPLTVEFKDILIQPLPRPASEGDATKPGFHVRTLNTEQGTRKYTVYVPAHYDGSREVPAVLFLHGAGERGEDGISPAQVGLGPAILAHPDQYPVIAVFPQARETWAAGSADAAAAIAALEDVLASYKVDRQRIILTGLSMGGRGTWEMAAAYPDRFSAVVPICGPGKLDDVPKLATQNIWAVTGSEERPQTLTNMRELVTALRKAGGHARLSELLSVGHNSWDRAYNNHRLAIWMISQRRL
jgi:predicted peptidase